MAFSTKRDAVKERTIGERYFHMEHHVHPRPALQWGAVGLAIGIALWWMGSILMNSPYLPSPAAVAETLVDLFSRGDAISGLSGTELIMRTLSHYFPAFMLGFLLAVPAGILIGINETAGHLSRPFIEVLRPIAPIVFGPLFLIALGGDLGVFTVVFMGVFIPLISSIQFGVQHVDPLVLDTAQTLGAHKWVLFKKVILPAIVPNIVTGLKVAVGIGWICIIEAELILGTPGLGSFVLWSSQLGVFNQTFAGIVLIAAIGILTTLAVWVLERALSRSLGMEFESAPVTHC